MSTRSQILVEGSDAIVYRHSDGYPDGKSGVLVDLLPLVKDFVKYRGDDPFYLTAHILGEFIVLHRKWFKAFQRRHKKNGLPPMNREYEFLGHGVEAFAGEFHGDVEYIYLVKPDHVEIRVPTNRSGVTTLTETKVIRRVNFNGKAYRRPRKKAA